MMRLELIADKARRGEELTEEEVEFVMKALQAFIPVVERTIDWLLPTIAQVIAIWFDTLAKIEERMLEEQG